MRIISADLVCVFLFLYSSISFTLRVSETLNRWGGVAGGPHVVCALCFAFRQPVRVHKLKFILI